MTTKIQIVGKGCSKCERLEANAREAATALGLDFEIEKVQGLDAIVAMGVALTPALAVDGEVKHAGRVASVDEIKGMLA